MAPEQQPSRCLDFGGMTAAGRPCRRLRASSPCPGHEPAQEERQARTCGDFGGVNSKGEPCGRHRRSERCPEHRDLPPEEAAQAPASVNTVAQSNMRESQERFLEALPRLQGNISLAAHQASVARRSHYDWLRRDPTYRARYQEALEQARDRLRGEIHRRAVVGWDEPWKLVNQGDGEVRVINRRRYSDRILLRLAEAHLPEFRRKLDVRVVEREMEGMSDEELMEEVRQLLDLLEGSSQELEPEATAG
jgi:hypothetical protein